MSNFKRNSDEFQKFDGFIAECEIGIVDKSYIPAIEKLKEIVKPYDDKIHFFVRVNDSTILKSNNHYGIYEIHISTQKVDNDFGYFIDEEEFPLTDEIEAKLELRDLAKEIKSAFGYRYGRFEEENLNAFNSKEDLRKFILDDLDKRSAILFCSHLPIAKLYFTDEEIEANNFDKNKRVSKSKEGVKINSVYETENGSMRVALTYEGLIFATPNHREYNYLDKDRLFYRSYNNETFLFFDMALSVERVEEFLNKISYNEFHNSDKIYFDLAEIETHENNKKVSKRLEAEKDEADEALRKALKNELDRKGFVMNNGIKVSLNGFIEFNGLKIGKNEWHIEHYLSRENLDFNDIFNDLCENASCSFDNEELFLGKFSVRLREATRYYIDDIRINKAEIKELLKRAICFDNKEDYYKLLTDVSKCSIKIHNALCSGILIKVNSQFNNRGDDNIVMKLSITRDKNKHSIVYDNGTKKVGIKNINGLFSIAEQSSRYFRHDFAGIRAVLLENTRLPESEVNLVLAEGFKYYKEAVKKSEELLADTLKVLNVELTEYDSEQAYIINGKLKRYLVTERLKIYEYPNMKYICVIDRGRADNVVGKDKLVSRLYALSNDNLVVGDIHTLK